MYDVMPKCNFINWMSAFQACFLYWNPMSWRAVQSQKAAGLVLTLGSIWQYGIGWPTFWETIADFGLLSHVDKFLGIFFIASSHHKFSGVVTLISLLVCLKKYLFSRTIYRCLSSSPGKRLLMLLNRDIMCHCSDYNLETSDWITMSLFPRFMHICGPRVVWQQLRRIWHQLLVFNLHHWLSYDFILFICFFIPSIDAHFTLHARGLKCHALNMINNAIIQYSSSEHPEICLVHFVHELATYHWKQ